MWYNVRYTAEKSLNRFDIPNAPPQVKRVVLSALALQDVGTALGVPKILKALPPHIQVSLSNGIK